MNIRLSKHAVRYRITPEELQALMDRASLEESFNYRTVPFSQSLVIPADAGIHTDNAVRVDPRRSLPSTPIGGGDDRKSGDDKGINSQSAHYLPVRFGVRIELNSRVDGLAFEYTDGTFCLAVNPERLQDLQKSYPSKKGLSLDFDTFKVELEVDIRRKKEDRA